jgi:hypothetical protein
MIPTPVIMLPWEFLHSIETVVGTLERNFYSDKKRTRSPTMNTLVMNGKNDTAMPQSYSES